MKSPHDGLATPKLMSTPSSRWRRRSSRLQFRNWRVKRPAGSCSTTRRPSWRQRSSIAGWLKGLENWQFVPTGGTWTRISFTRDRFWTDVLKVEFVDSISCHSLTTTTSPSPPTRPSSHTSPLLSGVSLWGRSGGPCQAMTEFKQGPILKKHFAVKLWYYSTTCYGLLLRHDSVTRFGKISPLW